MIPMLTAIFMTASRAGFVDLVISGAVTLWHFGVRGKRPGLIVAVLLAVALLGGTAGQKLYARFAALNGGSKTEASAYQSYEDRMYLMRRAVEGIEHYPLFGIGDNNFITYSGIWHQVHMTYLQVGVEGGIPALILYLMFFRCGFKNLKIMRKAKGLDQHTVLFVGALHSSLIGFAVGALFAPEATQFFPFFAVAFSSTLLATLRERDAELQTEPPAPTKPRHFLEVYADHGTPGTIAPVR
jgi:O-antigen ligase